MTWLARSAAGEELTRYHVEAGIAWEHCRAPSFANTDWQRIAQRLYETLDRIASIPLHSLNRAVAEAFLHGRQTGLERLVRSSGTRSRPLSRLARGDRRTPISASPDIPPPSAAWREALRFTTARADQEFLRRRIAICRPDRGGPSTE